MGLKTKPMLAHNYHKHGHKIVWPAFVQPKLNGVRCISTENGELFSRNNKQFTCLRHIEECVPKEFSWDGELYYHGWSFQNIVSAVRRDNPSDQTSKVQFWIYDLIDYAAYDGRLDTINHHIKENIVIKKVPTIQVESHKAMLKQHKLFVKQGFEGSIIRNVSGAYVCNKRSFDLQKLKDFIDGEFLITGAKSGQGKEEGMVVWICENEDGKRFDVRPRGTYEERTKLLQMKDKIIGKKLTVRYQERSHDNIPIFPVGIIIRDYE